jgi:hypothetical protein
MSETFPHEIYENDIEQEPSAKKILNVIDGHGYLNEDYGYDQETIAEILNIEFSEALETTYSYLTSVGLDADEVLAEFFD